MRKPTIWFPNKSHTKRSVQLKKTASSLKFRIYKEEELYYREAKTKALISFAVTADMRLCFRLCKLLVFS